MGGMNEADTNLLAEAASRLPKARGVYLEGGSRIDRGRLSNFVADGRTYGLGFTGYNWLVMRLGVDTVQPEVHVHAFVSAVLGRKVSDAEAVAAVIATRGGTGDACPPAGLAHLGGEPWDERSVGAVPLRAAHRNPWVGDGY
jgi:hypothetical protein